MPAGLGPTTPGQPGLGEGGGFSSGFSTGFDRSRVPPDPVTNLTATLNPPTDPSSDAFVQAAKDAELNPNPAVEWEIFESAFTDPPPDDERPASGLRPAPDTVALHARSQFGVTGRASLSVKPGRKAVKGRPAATTRVGKSVLKNATEIEETGTVFVDLLDGAIEELRRKRPNSDEGKAALKIQIADYEDLKCRVEAFLATASQFSAKRIQEPPVVAATMSLEEGIADWWTKDHCEICDLTLRLALFGTGLGLCVLAGAGGPLSALIPGAMFGGKRVVEAIREWRKTGS